MALIGGHAIVVGRSNICNMVKAQGYVIDENGMLILPEGITPKMAVHTGLVPYCPKCGKPMSMNLRADHTFVEEEGWRRASERYVDFCRGIKTGGCCF